MDPLTVITPTGCRPEAFRLCTQYLFRQRYDGPVQWIIVDDGLPETEIPRTGVVLGSEGPATDWQAKPPDLRPQGTQGPDSRTPLRVETVVLRPKPSWTPGRVTLARNLLAAFPEIRYKKVVFWEDDDWYREDYLAAVSRRLDAAPLVGEQSALYYNVRLRRWRVNQNLHHSSLCQTACQRSVLPTLETLCRISSSLLDVNLFRRTVGRRLFSSSGNCIGIKGLPGRPGAGVGGLCRGSGWALDPKGSVLEQLIGKDAENYVRFYQH